MLQGLLHAVQILLMVCSPLLHLLFMLVARKLIMVLVVRLVFLALLIQMLATVLTELIHCMALLQQ